MSTRTVFNRRIGPDEYEEWATLPSDYTPGLDNVEARKWITRVSTLPDSIAYIATVECESVGGALLYHDKRRRGVALIALRAAETVKAQLLPLLCRSSLPYFSTTHLKTVDAVLPKEDSSTLTFPPGIEIPSWAERTLTELGFRETQTLSSFTFKWTSSDAPIQTSLPWDTTPSVDGADRLVFRERRNTLLNCNHIRFVIELAASHGALHTLSKGSRTVASCCGPLILSSQAIVPLVVVSSRSDIVYDEIASWLFSETRAAGLDTLSILLCGEGQRELVTALEQTAPSVVAERELRLLRRSL